MSSSTKIDNRKKKLFLGKGPKQGLKHTVSAEKKYLINFCRKKKTYIFV